MNINCKTGFLLSEHKPVAIVVMASVAMVQVGIDAAIARVLRFVPVINNLNLTIRIL